VAICSATISLAHRLGLKVVAEGVETLAQREKLCRDHGCDFLQGYLFSRPVPIAQFEAFALERR
jgi:EAL domain-containing protein (putative c-di-GMP-specific phosphodiesterase class I)